MQLSPGKLQGMKRLSDKNGIFKMTAVDQRPPIKKPMIAPADSPISPLSKALILAFNIPPSSFLPAISLETNFE